MSDRNKSCEERIDDSLKAHLKDLKRIWKGVLNGKGKYYTELEEYGLCFDYVEPNTFEDQDEGYFRWQLCWGGPSSEFRFYCNHTDFTPYHIEYWFLDWFDGAHRVLTGEDEELLTDILNYFDPSLVHREVA